VDHSQSDRRRYQKGNVLRKPRPEEPRAQVNHPALWAFPEVNSWINVLFRRVDNLLDSEAMWQSFRSDVVGSSSHVQAQRYVRINPKITSRTPKMDDKSQVDNLSDDVTTKLRSIGMRDKILRITYRLVASCFYFETVGPSREVDDHLQVQGMWIVAFIDRYTGNETVSITMLILSLQVPFAVAS